MDRKFLFKEEQLAYDSLQSLNIEQAKSIIMAYIQDNRLHSEYADLLSQLLKGYINDTNSFIEIFKRDVNNLYIGEMFEHKVLENVDIDEKNWFWYARLLKHTEDEVYPKRNFLQPTYLLGRLKPIIVNMDAEELKNKADDELYELYKLCLNLMGKYGLENCDCNKEVDKL